MKIRNGWWIGIVLCGLLGALAWGQMRPPGAPGAPPRPAPFAAPAPPPPPRPAMDNTILPDENVPSMPLENWLGEFRDQMPDLHCVIISGPGTKMPVLPALSTKNLSVGQFMDFLKAAFPGLDIQVIDGPKAPLYVIHLPNTDEVALPDIMVKIYPLKEIVLSMVGANATEDAKKKALNDVLSLLQTAVSDLGDKSQYAMNVHEPTMTLIFKGTPKMTYTLDQAITALEPKGVVVDMQRKLANQDDKLQDAMRELVAKQQQLKEKTLQFDDLSRQLLEDKYRLEMDQKFHPPTTRQ